MSKNQNSRSHRRRKSSRLKLLVSSGDASSLTDSNPDDPENIRERRGYESAIIKSKVNQIWRWDTLEDAHDELFNRK